MEATPR